MRLIPGDPAGRQPFPCLSCIARGLPCLLGRPRSGELLPPLFTLACMGMNPIRAVCFLWHFPSRNPWEVPVSRFHGTRCLVMSGLSSTPARRPEQRPPEPDRHGLHTLSAARGKAQSRRSGHFCSPPASENGSFFRFKNSIFRPTCLQKGFRQGIHLISVTFQEYLFRGDFFLSVVHPDNEERQPFPFFPSTMGHPLNKVKRPQDHTRGRSNLLPMKTSLIP